MCLTHKACTQRGRCTRALNVPWCAQADSSTALAQAYMRTRMHVLPIMSSMLTWVTNAPQAAALFRSAPSSCALRGRRPAERAAARARWTGGACGAQGADSHTPHEFVRAWPASAQGACGRPFASGDPHARRSREALEGCKRRPMHSVAWAYQAAAHVACGRGGGSRRRCRKRPGALGRRGVLGPAALGAPAAGRRGRAPCYAARACNQALASCAPRVQGPGMLSRSGAESQGTTVHMGTT